jgi:hypothetical protein
MDRSIVIFRMLCKGILSIILFMLLSNSYAQVISITDGNSNGGSPDGYEYGYESSGAVYRNIAQSFTAGGNWSLSSINLFMYEYSGDNTTVWVEIWSDNSGDPGSLITNGATNSVSLSGVSDFTWTSFTFSSEPSLTQSSVYWIVVRSSLDNDWYYCGFDNGDPIIGNMKQRETSGTWSNVDSNTSIDMLFELFESAGTPKALNTITYNQASTDDVAPGASNKEILRLDFDVTGSTGTLNLNSIEVASNNTSDTDIATNGVKLYRTSSTTFATDNLLGSAQSFSSGTVTFSSLAYDLPSGTSYIWVVYDIDAGATLSNTVDAIIEANKIDVASSTYPAAQESPTGNRTIAIDYCALSAADTGDGDYINRVVLNDLDNTSGNDGGGVDYTSEIANVNQGESYTLHVYPYCYGSISDNHIWAFIDWNQDGDFEDVGESYDLGGTMTDGEDMSISVDVAAGATLGNTRMRVINSWSVEPGSYGCSMGTYGEWEDYTVNVQSSAAKSLNSITYNQASTDDVLQGANDKEILRLDFDVTGSTGTLNLNSIEVASNNTSDTDIATNGVKLYRTSSTTFATDNLLGSAQSFSSGTVTFSSLAYDLPSGTSYIWVVYDIDAGATLSNTVDAIIEANKIDVASSTYPAAQESPIGTRTISMPSGGSDCADPYVINSLPFSNTGMTTNGFGDDYDINDACGSYYMNGDDFVFEYTPSVNECVDIVLSNTDTWTGVFVTQACPDVGTCVAENTSSSGNPSLSKVSLSASTTYYIIISTFPSPQFTPFDISVSSVSCGGSDEDGVWPGLNLGTLICPSTNEYVSTYDNTSDSDDCALISGAENIFSFTINDQTDVEISTCGSSLDTKLYLYDASTGDCGSGNYLAYNDDDCSLQSRISLNDLTAGTYVIVVEGYLGAEGAYDLYINLSDCGGDCPDCTNGIRDCQETGIDCGGPDCAPCEGYLHPTTGLQNTYCGGCMIPTRGGKYYDDAGAGVGYSTYINSVYRTFCPEDAGKCLKATFSEMDVDPAADELIVISGPTQNSEVLWHGWGNMDDASLYTYDGAWSSGEFTSTDPSGCLTFRFYSDGLNNTYEGWDVTFSSVDCSGPTGTDPNDCENSIGVCNNFDFSGASTGPGLTNDGCLGCVTSENYSNWYTIEIKSSGTLAFTIAPATSTDDYDFALYQSYDCNDLGTPVRCSFAANEGSTGMSSAYFDTSEDVTGDAWVSDVSVTEGETYFLLINNWSPDGNGFDLIWDLSGGASLGVQPKIESAINASNNIFEVEISEPIKCSSVSTDGSDFVLDCTGTTTETECLANSIIAANPMNCLNDSTSWIEITLANPLPQAKAVYENDWKIVCSGLNTVVDVCNNPLNGGSPYILLPVEFLFVNGVCHNGFVEILWSTATENNNEYFTIQRSEDGERFVDMRTVLGAGNSVIPINYSWVDSEPLNGFSYYRIKQTDYDGNTTQSDIVFVNCNQNPGSFNIVPNPFKEEVFIMFDVPTRQTVRLSVNDMLGNLVFEGKIPEGRLKYHISELSNVVPGTYSINLIYDDSVITQKLIKM